MFGVVDSEVNEYIKEERESLISEGFVLYF